MEKSKQPKTSKSLSKEEEADVSLATAMGSVALSMPQMQEGIAGMAQSADPVMVAGQLVAGIVLNIKEQADKNNMKLSDRIWMADNGVADRLVEDVVDIIEAVTGAELAGQEEKVWIEALNVIKMASKSGSAVQGGMPAGAPGGQPPAAPPAQGMGPFAGGAV